MQKVKKSCRKLAQKLAQKLSCMDTPYEEPPLPAQSGGTSSASLRTPAGSSQPMIDATFAVRIPPHYSAGKDPATEDDDDDDPLGFHRQHGQGDEWPQDEIGMSQLGGAPFGTQGASQVLTKIVCFNT